MAQNEEMKRLLLKGIVVGYKREWLEDIDSFKEPHIITTYYKELPASNQWLAGSCSPIMYDAFEPGVKVGDEWWFTGDRIECTITLDEEVPEINKFNIPLVYNGFCFFLDKLELSVQLKQLDSYKCIGNIHDLEANKTI